MQPSGTRRQPIPQGLLAGRRVAIVASEFNRPVTAALIRGATDVLRQAGAASRSIQLVWVPGAFELPVVAQRLAQGRPRPAAVIALGALIRGDTPQYAVIAHAAAQGLSQVALQARIPVTFGLIVAETRSQAKARAGGVMGNRGREAAQAALAVLKLFRSLS